MDKKKQKHTEEHRRKISLANIGKNSGKHLSPKTEFKKGSIPWNKGLTKQTDKRVNNISKNLLGEKNYMFGKKQSQDFIDKRFKKIIGSKRSLEVKIKMSLAMKGIKRKPLSSEHKIKIGLSNKGQKRSEEFRNKMRLQWERLSELERKKRCKSISQSKIGINSGEKCHFWNGGISKLPYDQKWNNNFKNEIRNRDNQVCMNCGKHREKLRKALSIHHINYDKELTIKENCISLCNQCHSLTQLNRDYWMNLFQSKLSQIYGYKYFNNKAMININKSEETK